MARFKDISSVWNNIKEIDLKPIRDAATSRVNITIVGEDGAGKHALAEGMRTDPARAEIHTQSPLTLLTVETGMPPPSADLIILMVEAARQDLSIEQLLAQKWSEAGKNILVFINKTDLTNGMFPVESGQGWMAAKVVSGSVRDGAFLLNDFVPAVLEILPQQHLALGRQFPIFRLAIAHQLINETCFSNAAYSFSTGVAEIVPVLDLPLNLTDLVVLTKSQAFLAYKLGLVLGFSTRWQDYVTEFGGVIGTGFVWRQAARSLVGLIPGWGIIPKVAIAYSGTYVVGHAILGWYLSGRHLNSKQMRELSVQAFMKGKSYALRLVEKLPRRRTDTRILDQRMLPSSSQELVTIETVSGPDEIVITKHKAAGTAEIQSATTDSQSQPVEQAARKDGRSQKKKRPGKLNNLRAIRLSRKKKDVIPAMAAEHICTNCGKASSADAAFCQYCGLPFESIVTNSQV